MSAADGPTVIDATALSNFASIDRLDLLERLPRAVTVPAVRDELRAGADIHPHLTPAIQSLADGLSLVELTTREVKLTDEHVPTLDSGEAEALAVARAREGTLVTDDGTARSRAREHDVPITGSLGVLVVAIDDDVIDVAQANTWLAYWVDEMGFRAPSTDITEYL